MGGGVEAVNRRRDTTSPPRDNTQIARPKYNCNAPGRVSPMAVSPPRFANSDVSGPSLANVIPYSAHTSSAIQNLVFPALNFYGERKGIGRPDMLVEYLVIYPETSPNSAKLPAVCMRLTFSNDNAHAVPIICAPHRGWFAYDVARKDQGAAKLGLTQIPHAKFVGFISNFLSLARRRNVFKQTRRGTTHPRRKFLHELEIALSNDMQLRELIRDGGDYVSYGGCPWIPTQCFCNLQTRLWAFRIIQSGKETQETT